MFDCGLADQDISRRFSTINGELFFKMNVFLILGKKMTGTAPNEKIKVLLCVSKFKSKPDELMQSSYVSFSSWSLLNLWAGTLTDNVLALSLNFTQTPLHFASAGTMVEIIWFVNFVAAIFAVVGWIKKPKTKSIAIAGLICGVVSIATAQYTIVSLVMFTIFAVLIVLIYSVKTYAEFESHIVQAQVLFKGPSKKQLMNLTKTALERPIIGQVNIAEGLELIAQRGEKFSSAKEIIVAAAHLSVALSADFLMCIDILIKLKRYFKFQGEYEIIADKLCVAASRGVQVEEVNQAFDAFNKECYFPDKVTIDEFLAIIVTLSRSENRGETAGFGLAGLINGLTEAQLSCKGDKLLENYALKPDDESIKRWADKMIVITDKYIELSKRFTAKSEYLNKQILQLGQQGVKFFASDNPIFGEMEDLLGEFLLGLQQLRHEVNTITPPDRMKSYQNQILESFEIQIPGIANAKAGIESLDFSKFGRAMQQNQEGVAKMMNVAKELQKRLGIVRR